MSNYIDEKSLQTIIRAFADRVGDKYAFSFRQSLIQNNKVATAKTINSVELEKFDISAQSNMFVRRVRARPTWKFIQSGRRAGAKMPIVRVAGASRRGKGVFLPVPELIEWFRAKKIPEEAWFPILWAIKRRGIKPVDILTDSINRGKPHLQFEIDRLVSQIQDEIVKNFRESVKS